MATRDSGSCGRTKMLSNQELPLLPHATQMWLCIKLFFVSQVVTITDLTTEIRSVSDSR